MQDQSIGVQNPSPFPIGSQNPGYCEYKENSDVQAAFQELSGYNTARDKTGCAATPRVQREQSGECGGHWQEQCIQSELMTPVLEFDGTSGTLVRTGGKTSTLTTASLRDIGYATISDEDGIAQGLITFDADDVLGSCKCPPESTRAGRDLNTISKPVPSLGDEDMLKTNIIIG